MREIKFRAWHEHKKKMFSAEEMGEDQLTLSVDGRGFINVNNQPNLSEFYTFMIPMQYTGLKDKQGVEIYEGDIVLWADQDEYSFQAQVQWGDYEWYMDDVHFREVYRFEDIDSTDLEVIGNIYENSDLLETSL